MAEREPVDQEKRTTLRQFAALGAVSPLAGLLESDHSQDETDTRPAILGYLSATPGAHFSKIRDDLSLGTGETQHHLRKLVDANVIESFSDGEYRRFVPAGRFTPYERTILGYLRRETPRRFLIALIENPDASGAELAEQLSVSPATISRTASELLDVELIERGSSYRIIQPEVIITMLVRYAESFDVETVQFADRADTFIKYYPTDLVD